MKELDGRTAILTGASRGLGPYIARALAAQGTNVVLSARSAELLEAVAGGLSASRARILVVPCDVANAEERASLVARATAAFGAVDVLVNNAGIGAGGRYHQLDPGSIAGVLDVDLVAPLLLIREVLPGMLERGRGHVVNIASLAGKAPVPYSVAYGAAKAGLISATRSLQAECGGRGVNFSVISPGYVTDAGMFHDRTKGAGIDPGRTGFQTTSEKVAASVVRAIKRERLDVNVASGPVRLLTTMAFALPGFANRVVGITGTKRTLATMAGLGDGTGSM